MSEKGTADKARAEVPTSGKPAISAYGLAKRYGKVEAVRGSDRWVRRPSLFPLFTKALSRLRLAHYRT